MTIGTLIFIAEGISTYRNRVLVETFSPIMAHNARSKSRSIHQVLQMMGSILLLLGMMFIIANKIENKRSKTSPLRNTSLILSLFTLLAT